MKMEEYSYTNNLKERIRAMTKVLISSCRVQISNLSNAVEEICEDRKLKTNLSDTLFEVELSFNTIRFLYDKYDDEVAFKVYRIVLNQMEKTREYLNRLWGDYNEGREDTENLTNTLDVLTIVTDMYDSIYSESQALGKFLEPVSTY